MQPYFDTNHAAGLLILIIVPASGNDGTQRIFPRDGRAERSHQDRPARLLARRGGMRDRRHERRALSRPAHRPGGHDPARCRGLRRRHGEPAGGPGAARVVVQDAGRVLHLHRHGQLRPAGGRHRPLSPVAPSQLHRSPFGLRRHRPCVRELGRPGRRYAAAAGPGDVCACPRRPLHRSESKYAGRPGAAFAITFCQRYWRGWVSRR